MNNFESGARNPKPMDKELESIIDEFDRGVGAGMDVVGHAVQENPDNPQTDTRESSETLLGDKQIADFIDSALDIALLPREAEVLRHRLFEDMTHKEVGQELDRSRSRARQIEVSALRKLRKYLLSSNTFNTLVDKRGLVEKALSKFGKNKNR